jgi:hypothetical protein
LNLTLSFAGYEVRRALSLADLAKAGKAGKAGKASNPPPLTFINDRQASRGNNPK